MKKRSITRKLIMSISTAAMTAVCLGTTTYAWFSQNRNVWVENTDLYVDSYDGLLISLDGTNFSQDISSDQLKMNITNALNEEAARDAYKKISLIGTSMKQDNQGEIEKDVDDNVLFEHDIVNHTDNKYINTVKLYDQIDDSLVAYLIIETDNNEIKSFKAYDKDDVELEVDDSNAGEYIINNGPDMVCDITGLSVNGYVRDSMTVNVSADKTLKYVVNYVDNGYTHGKSESEVNKNYLKFDLYFRIISDNNSGGSHDEYDLKFTDETYLESKEKAKAILANGFDAKKLDSNNELKNHTYLAGDEIEFDVANAMRIAVDSKDGLNIFEVTNEYDLGSVAIEGATEEKHNKETNAMFNYYNSIHPNYAFTEAAVNGKRFVTNDKFTDVSLGKFTYNEQTGNYNDLKTTVYIWLEGWDADYFLGAPIDSRMLNVKLDFKYKDEA